MSEIKQVLAEVGAAAVEMGFVQISPQPLDESLFFEVAANGIKLALHTGYLADKHRGNGSLKVKWFRNADPYMFGSLRVWDVAPAIAMLRWLREGR